MLTLIPIPALQTNYIWTVISAAIPSKAVIVDPGEAKPILTYLNRHKLDLAAILITHHHYDHTGGLNEILTQYDCPVYAGNREPIKQATHRLADGENFQIEMLNLNFQALHIPGHTNGHTAFYGHELLFSGDTLFAAGCGRNFEGTHAQLYASLQTLAKLPKETQIYCGHEYTQKNLQFALMVEPDNQDIIAKLKLIELMQTEHQCTLPSSIAEELNTNVFLRCEHETVKKAAETYSGQKLDNPKAVFAILRDWKDNF